MKLTRQRWLKLSGWTVPLAYAVLALTAGQTLPRLEYHFLPRRASRMSASSAISVCSSIAGGMISLTAIVFLATLSGLLTMPICHEGNSLAAACLTSAVALLPLFRFDLVSRNGKHNEADGNEDLASPRRSRLDASVRDPRVMPDPRPRTRCGGLNPSKILKRQPSSFPRSQQISPMIGSPPSSRAMSLRSMILRTQCNHVRVGFLLPSPVSWIVPIKVRKRGGTEAQGRPLKLGIRIGLRRASPDST